MVRPRGLDAPYAEAAAMFSHGFDERGASSCHCHASGDIFPFTICKFSSIVFAAIGH